MASNDLTITGNICIPSQPPTYLVNVWVPVFVMRCLGFRVVYPREERWLSQVHGSRADTKRLSDPFLNSLSHITAKNTTQHAKWHTSPASSTGSSIHFFRAELIPQLINPGEHPYFVSYFALNKGNLLHQKETPQCFGLGFGFFCGFVFFGVFFVVLLFFCFGLFFFLSLRISRKISYLPPVASVLKFLC